jgi:hypothetical protein
MNAGTRESEPVVSTAGNSFGFVEMKTVTGGSGMNVLAATPHQTGNSLPSALSF